MSAYAYPLLIKQLLHTPLANAPGQSIVYRDRVRLDYRSLIGRIGRLGSALQRQLGVLPGQTVAVMDWDSHRYLECFFAIPMLGAVLQTVNVRLSPEQIAYTLNHARADVLLVHEDFLPLLAALQGKLETVARFVLLTDADAPPELPAQFSSDYEALLALGDPAHQFPDFDENTRATTFYTTGTTGLPKGVYFSHRQLVLHTLATAAALGTASAHGRFGGGDVYMPITPMFHVHAWGFPYVATMLGVKQVYPGRYQPDLLLALIRDEGVTFSHCVPTILHLLLTSPLIDATDLSRWKVVIGGSALPKGLAQAALARGVDIFAGYGLSETCPILSLGLLEESETADHDAALAQRVKAGRAIPLVDLRVTDADGRELPHDGQSAGEVVVRAPWLTQGYLHDEAASGVLWAGGYLHTGDIGTRDANGVLNITDRLKDVIKCSGEWLSSLELESLISEHPAVDEVAVIGLPDPKWGERPCALVVLKPGMTATEEALRVPFNWRVEAGSLPRYARLMQIRFVTRLPRTSVGKMDKKAMRGGY
ncbi:MAG: fatty acid--CoA ligase [Gallionella sp.]|nr:fatty acid--CoA ligase [Gallionella sp.]MDD4945650.1 fatty acid--CoA ligase [Gallionella sp.]MDD5612579.1 fatty acid--CoA ligase [Gallionella sp.]